MERDEKHHLRKFALRRGYFLYRADGAKGSSKAYALQDTRSGTLQHFASLEQVQSRLTTKD